MVALVEKVVQWRDFLTEKTYTISQIHQLICEVCKDDQIISRKTIENWTKSYPSIDKNAKPLVFDRYQVEKMLDEKDTRIQNKLKRNKYQKKEYADAQIKREREKERKENEAVYRAYMQQMYDHIDDLIEGRENGNEEVHAVEEYVGEAFEKYKYRFMLEALFKKEFTLDETKLENDIRTLAYDPHDFTTMKRLKSGFASYTYPIRKEEKNEK